MTLHDVAAALDTQPHPLLAPQQPPTHIHPGPSPRMSISISLINVVRDVLKRSGNSGIAMEGRNSRLHARIAISFVVQSCKASFTPSAQQRTMRDDVTRAPHPRILMPRDTSVVFPPSFVSSSS